MSERRFKKGDAVTFRLGVRTVQGVVKEDRGPLGIKGRHLYLVEFGPALYEDATSQIELGATGGSTRESSSSHLKRSRF